jgi:hypothetical protein
LNRNTGHEFLVFAGDKMGFMVNRNQFTSSLFIDSVDHQQDVKGPCLGTINYGGQNLLLFDINSYLETVFRYGSAGSADLALVIPLSLFDTLSVKKLFSIFELCTQQPSGDFIALRIPNQSSIEHIPLSALKPLPKVLRRRSLHEGILGIRFPGNGLMYYFVDLAIMVVHMIEEGA